MESSKKPELGTDTGNTAGKKGTGRKRSHSVPVDLEDFNDPVSSRLRSKSHSADSEKRPKIDNGTSVPSSPTVSKGRKKRLHKKEQNQVKISDLEDEEEKPKDKKNKKTKVWDTNSASSADESDKEPLAKKSKAKSTEGCELRKSESGYRVKSKKRSTAHKASSSFSDDASTSEPSTSSVRKATKLSDQGEPSTASDSPVTRKGKKTAESAPAEQITNRRVTRSGGTVEQPHPSSSKGSRQPKGAKKEWTLKTKEVSGAANTGSCASTNRRTSRSGKLPMASQDARDGANGSSLPEGVPNSAPEVSPPAVESALNANSNGNAPPGSVILGMALSHEGEPDESDMNRLQALLESRGLPPHIFGRMHTILNRSMGSTNSRVQQLIAGLQAVGDEGRQLQAALEMGELLVMNNEDTLPGFPIRQAANALVTLLAMEHNFDIMNNACRALTYMMECLPRSSSVIVEAIPAFLRKLEVIQCMDVAEQSLTALEMLSRRHAKSILQNNGVSACLTFLDFFGTNAQRAALSITANCCQNLHTDEFHFVKDSLPILASRLTMQDKKSVESVCLALSRLVESFQNEPARLQEIAGNNLLNNFQQLLVVSPPILSSATFIMVIRLLSVLCSKCPDLALKLLSDNFADTLFYLLRGSVETTASADEAPELVSRSPQELYEITSLIGELMPKLPSDGVFAIDSLLVKPTTAHLDSVQWQWKDDKSQWRPYNPIDSRIIEAAHQGGEDGISLSTMNHMYYIDFTLMQQINEETRTSRSIQRKINNLGAGGGASPSNTGATVDVREQYLKDNPDTASHFVRTLFTVLIDVYSSSAGPAVRHKCLSAILRMVYYSPPDLLKGILKPQVVSGQLAGMLSAVDLKIAVGALQLAHILMEKMPEVFGVHFKREGVVHQVQRLSDPSTLQGSSPSVESHSPGVHDKSITPSEPTTSLLSSSAPSSSLLGTSSLSTLLASSGPSTASSSPLSSEERQAVESSVSTPNSRLGEVLKRKRPGKKGGASRKAKSEESSGAPTLLPPSSLPTSAADLLATSPPVDMEGRPAKVSTSTRAANFLASLNPSHWVGRGKSHNSPSTSSNLSKSLSKVDALFHAKSVASYNNANREKIKLWIQQTAVDFLAKYFSGENGSSESGTKSILDLLTEASENLLKNTENAQEHLEAIRSVLMESDISSFEISHSGLIKALISYLTAYDIEAKADKPNPIRDARLRTFLHVFLGTSLDSLKVVQPISGGGLHSLVQKLIGCVGQMEQFPMRVNELAGGAGRTGSSVLKFFNTHQLKCNLVRHPSCANLKAWKGGPVKIDPLALMQAIERYLVVRGYGHVREKELGDSDDDNTDDDLDDNLASVLLTPSATSRSHRLQFLICDNVVPHNMTIYQAVRQFSPAAQHYLGSDLDGDSEIPLGSAAIWVQTHTIHYRLAPESDANGADHSSITSSLADGKKGKGVGKTAAKKKGDDLWTEGVVPEPQSPLAPYLIPSLPSLVTVEDDSLEALVLLRILYGINRYWGSLYYMSDYYPVLQPSDFLSTKLTAKANRQLQDPLVIMTGNLPPWLTQIGLACPFLFPFETRQLLFYATSFDRDRALQRLLDATPELNSSDTQERVAPRLERRKRTVSRTDILRQAEQIFQDLTNTRALLEIHYENEVGTGLGPTLEFYSLVSRELQRLDLELWKSDKNGDQDIKSETTEQSVQYVTNTVGLFPVPLPRTVKAQHLSRVKAKFKFLGKFLAKAIMDSRMVDLPFSPVLFRWLLGQESTLTGSDLRFVDPAFARSFQAMAEVVREKLRIERDSESGVVQCTIEALTLQGASISDLGLDFTVPGTDIEMRRGGKDIVVTIENLEQYLKSVAHWILVEGVRRQMEALREGFESIFPISHLRLFQAEELEMLLCGSSQSESAEKWELQALIEAWKPDHGYTAESRTIKELAETVSRFSKAEQRSFLQFVTGSPRLPVGGFKSLSPPLTIVRKTVEPNQNPDDFLPSVMTCVNYLKLPEYTSIEILRSKLKLASEEGQMSFHLS